MKFLAITRRHTDRFSETQFAEHLPAEADQARANYASGVFREIYSRGDVPGAVIVIEAPDLDAAAGLMAALPLSQHEMMEVEVIPLRPYRGFIGG
jgi:uncharacterized protein YciI